MDLKQLLENYKAYNEQEEKDRELMIEYLDNFDNVYERKNSFGHITCSPWIINKDHTKVLMIYHNIYKSWGWCGGHCDGDKNLLHVAIKEGMEETGLRHLEVVKDGIFSIEVLPVPPHYKNNQFISSHVHLNITFLCVGDEDSPLSMKPDENSGVQWIKIEEINDVVSEEDMKPVYQKLIEKSKYHIGYKN